MYHHSHSGHYKSKDRKPKRNCRSILYTQRNLLQRRQTHKTKDSTEGVSKIGRTARIPSLSLPKPTCRVLIFVGINNTAQGSVTIMLETFAGPDIVNNFFLVQNQQFKLVKASLLKDSTRQKYVYNVSCPYIPA